MILFEDRATKTSRQSGAGPRAIHLGTSGCRLLPRAFGSENISVGSEVGYDMATLRAFISFEMEDRWARDLLVQHAKAKNDEIEFYDYLVTDPFDSEWKSECKRRMAKTNGTIVLIGPTTSKSGAVAWEIAESHRQGHEVLGIQINNSEANPLPAGLPGTNVIGWDFDQVVEWLKTGLG